MKDITRINHVGIRVKDLATSRSFYEKLGFIFIEGPVGPEPVAVMEHPSGININFILNAANSESKNVLMDIPEKYTGYTHMALEVASLASITNQLKDKQIDITGGPITIPSGAQFIFVRDPDDNVIEFHKPA